MAIKIPKEIHNLGKMLTNFPCNSEHAFILHESDSIYDNCKILSWNKRMANACTNYLNYQLSPNLIEKIPDSPLTSSNLSSESNNPRSREIPLYILHKTLKTICIGDSLWMILQSVKNQVVCHTSVPVALSQKHVKMIDSGQMSHDVRKLAFGVSDQL